MHESIWWINYCRPSINNENLNLIVAFPNIDSINDSVNVALLNNDSLIENANVDKNKGSSNLTKEDIKNLKHDTIKDFLIKSLTRKYFKFY